MASARAVEVPTIKHSLHGFALTSVSIVSRPAGTAVLIRYSADSQPDPVTGKQVPSTVDRYYVPGPSGLAIVSLAEPDGVDNVDAFRQMITSFKWS